MTDPTALPARLAAQWEELDTRINLLPRYYADGTTPNGGQPMVRLHDVLMLVRKRAALLVGVEPQEEPTWLIRVRNYIRGVMRPQSVVGEGLWDRGRRSGLQEALNSIDAELAAARVGVEPPASWPDAEATTTASIVTLLRGMGYDDAANALAELHVEDCALRGVKPLVYYISGEPECDCNGGPQGEGLVSLPHEPTCASLRRGSQSPDLDQKIATSPIPVVSEPVE